uniref:RNA polymerase I-specific transcription initiation factor RRN3 n=2 Tax=Caenorhabditis japonica TaxID=281687 RepID=A0A8R1EHU0_CAEJA
MAIRHLCFTEEVFLSVIERFVPLVSIDHETEVVTNVLEDAEQNSHYEMAHHVVASVIRCFPLSAKTVLKCVKRAMPHFTRPAVTVAGYMRNLILMQKYIPASISKDIWETVFHRLTKDDAHNYDCEKKEEENKSPRLFALNDDRLIEDVVETKETDQVTPEQIEQRKGEQTLSYLDSVCTDIITYIRNVEIPEEKDESVDDTWLRNFKITGDKPLESDQLFGMFLEVLESTMLNAPNVQYVSFIWLYYCSLTKDFESRILELLWQVTIRMPRAPADSKKSQSAVAYLAAFLARAKYVQKDEAFIWLEEIFVFLRHYVDQFGSGSSQILPGLQRHGTFYAVSQCFFLVFAFRYKDFVKNQGKFHVLFFLTHCVFRNAGKDTQLGNRTGCSLAIGTTAICVETSGQMLFSYY